MSGNVSLDASFLKDAEAARSCRLRSSLLSLRFRTRSMETRQASGSGLTDFCDADRHYGQKKDALQHVPTRTSRLTL